MGLSFIPFLKQLAPVMAVGTVMLFSGCAVLAYLVAEEWPHRPDKPIEVNRAQVPLGLCAILYSFEGICLILPVETAMQQPQHFGKGYLRLV
jgi:proton-coupled amino acid transporter